MQQSGRSNLLDSAAAFLTDFVPPCIYGLCQVCGAEATGIHYAASTCEGCKGFFKRSLPVYRSYKCFFGGSCHIIPETRGRCKACRFQKCLQAGMSPDGNRNRGKGKFSVQADSKPGTSPSALPRPSVKQQKHQNKVEAISVQQNFGQESSLLSSTTYRENAGQSAGNFNPFASTRPFASSTSLVSSIATAGVHAQINRQHHYSGGSQQQQVVPATSNSFRRDLQNYHRTDSGGGSVHPNNATLNLLSTSSLSTSPADGTSASGPVHNSTGTMNSSSSTGNIFSYAVSPTATMQRQRQLSNSHIAGSSSSSFAVRYPQQQQQEYSPPVVIASGRAFDQQHNSSLSPLSLHGIVTPTAEAVASPRPSCSAAAEATAMLQHGNASAAHVMLPLQYQSNVCNKAQNDESATNTAEADDNSTALTLKINQLIDSFDSVVCSSIVCHLYTEWANQWMPNLLTARYNKHYLGSNLLYQPVVSISHYMAAFMKAITEYDEEMEHYATAIPGMKALESHVGYELRSHSCLSTFCVTFCEVLSEEESYYAFKCQDTEHTHWLSQTNYWCAALTPAGALPIFWRMTAYFRSLKLNDVIRALVVAAIIARPRGNDHLPEFVRSALPVTYFSHFKVKAHEWAPAEQVFSFLLNVIASHLSREYPNRHECIMRNLYHFFSDLALKLDVLDELMLQSIPFGFNEDGTFDWQRLLRFNLNEEIIPTDVARWLREGWEILN